MTQFINAWSPDVRTPFESIRHTRHFEEKCHPNRLLLTIYDEDLEFYVESISKNASGWYVNIMYNDPTFGWTIDNIEAIDKWLNYGAPMEAHLDRIERFKSLQS